MIPPHSYGEVSASCADGGVMRSARTADDPSVADYRATSPYEWGGKPSCALPAANSGPVFRRLAVGTQAAQDEVVERDRAGAGDAEPGEHHEVGDLVEAEQRLE